MTIYLTKILYLILLAASVWLMVDAVKFNKVLRLDKYAIQFSLAAACAVKFIVALAKLGN